MRAGQNTFWSRRTEHGGEVRRGKRKEARPVAIKCAMHVTLRAEQARGKWSLLTKRNSRFIQALLTKASRQWRVKVYELANVGNHLHLLLKAQSREGFANFLRVLGAQVATYVTGARRGHALGIRFWDLPAWSRLVENDFPTVRSYIIQNRWEAEGVIPHSPRRTKPRSASG